jgi:hypothetical protein
MSDPRFRSSLLTVVLLALGACTTPIEPDPTDDDPGDTEEAARHPRHDAGVDAATPPPADAATPHPDAAPLDGGGSTGGGTVGAGTVSCYTEGYPSTTCALSSAHCCFTNYSAQHDGECTASACSWGTIDCDGPEDCATGQHCCAHAVIDADYGLTGYKLGCQASACGAAPINQELCHPTSTTSKATCSNGGTCVSALGNDTDLPRSLYICK